MKEEAEWTWYWCRGMEASYMAWRRAKRAASNLRRAGWDWSVAMSASRSISARGTRARSSLRLFSRSPGFTPIHRSIRPVSPLLGALIGELGSAERTQEVGGGGGVCSEEGLQPGEGPVKDLGRGGEDAEEVGLQEVTRILRQPRHVVLGGQFADCQDVPGVQVPAHNSHSIGRFGGRRRRGDGDLSRYSAQ